MIYKMQFMQASVRRSLQYVVSCVRVPGLTAISARVWTVINSPQTGIVVLWRRHAGRHGSFPQRWCFTPSLAGSSVGVWRAAAAESLSIAQRDSCRR